MALCDDDSTINIVAKLFIIIIIIIKLNIYFRLVKHLYIITINTIRLFTFDVSISIRDLSQKKLEDEC